VSLYLEKFLCVIVSLFIKESMLCALSSVWFQSYNYAI